MPSCNDNCDINLLFCNAQYSNDIKKLNKCSNDYYSCGKKCTNIRKKAATKIQKKWRSKKSKKKVKTKKPTIRRFISNSELDRMMRERNRHRGMGKSRRRKSRRRKSRRRKSRRRKSRRRKRRR